MIKESIFSFLKIRKMPIIIFTGIVVIFGILFYLYDIPFDAIIYGCELSFVWCAVCLFIDFYKYYKRHKLLHINREQFFDDAEQLPEHMDIIEYDYQELAKELYQAKQELISKNRIAKKELLDYYGMWVHQIKTPIAALDILLQNTERMLYQLDEKEMMQKAISVSDMKMELFKIEQYVEMALNYLRVEDISSDLVFKKQELDDMVCQVIRKYAKIFISKKIKMDFKPTKACIVTDEKWFIFVLEQLISNALKYTKKEKEELKKVLTEEEYYVTQENGTERPFTNEYWDFNGEGIYVDITTGEPLFTSKDKFHSSCGWPAFSKPIDRSIIKEKVDKSHGMIRTEVRSKLGDSHLGHVFCDGPEDLGGLRYCINSASLKFIPKEELKEKGYEEYLELFK